MYQSIIVSAYWFSEGCFWSVNVTGYVTNDGPDEPVSIEVEPNVLENEEHDVDGVLQELEMIAENYISEAEIVPIHINGNEIKCATT